MQSVEGKELVQVLAHYRGRPVRLIVSQSRVQHFEETRLQAVQNVQLVAIRSGEDYKALLRRNRQRSYGEERKVANLEDCGVVLLALLHPLELNGLVVVGQARGYCGA